MARRRRSRRNIPFPNPRRRRHRARRNIPFPNPRRHRRHRRNPLSLRPITGAFSGVKDAMPVALYTTAGFIGTRIVSAFTLPMLGTFGQNDLVRIAGKAGTAYGLAVVGNMIFRGSFRPLLIGGLVEVLNEAVRNYVAPFVPALAAYDLPSELTDQRMGLYPDGVYDGRLGTYADMVYDDDVMQ